MSITINPGGEITTPGNSTDNQTGSWRTGQRPKRISEKCQHCAICFHFCPENAIKFEKEQMVGINYTYCKGCGICVKECPFGAIVMEAE